MAGPIGGYSYPVSYGQPGYYGQGVTSYNSNTAWAMPSSYRNYSGDYSGYVGRQGYYAPPSFSLFPPDMDISANDQFYNAVVNPNLGPVPDGPNYTPNAGNPQEFYDTVIDPSLQEAASIYNDPNSHGAANGVSDDMASFNSSLDSVTHGASETYNQNAPEAYNRRALEILTANDDEALKKIDTMGKHDGADHKISSRDLEAALNDYPDQFTDEQK